MDIAGGLAGGTMMTVATQTLLAATGQSMSDSPSAIIIGAGPSGLAMAHEMKHKLAFQDFTIYEKRDEVGGAWATNRYPGAGCDLPTHLHDFSFNLNPSWSKELCDREEVLEYINTTVDKFELRSHIHTSVEAVRAHWLEKTNMWCVTLKDSRTGVEFVRYATVLILAAGGMNNSRDVKIEGMDQFQGDLFHIAQWPAMWGSDGMDHVQRKRIAVIGNGCSAAQLIPKLVKSVADIKQWVFLSSSVEFSS
jgi:cation diffusion facilitator CzcD-associated flavoprotein CzcO